MLAQAVGLAEAARPFASSRHSVRHHSTRIRDSGNGASKRRDPFAPRDENPTGRGHFNGQPFPRKEKQQRPARRQRISTDDVAITWRNQPSSSQPFRPVSPELRPGTGSRGVVPELWWDSLALCLSQYGGRPGVVPAPLKCDGLALSLSVPLVVGLGYAFSHSVDAVAKGAAHAEHWLAVAGVLALAAWGGVRRLRRGRPKKGAS